MAHPGVRGGGGHAQMDYAESLVGQDQEDVERGEAGAGDGEEVDRDEFPRMVAEEGAPGLRATRVAPAHHVLGDGRFGDRNPSFRISPWMCGAPQSGFSRLIGRTRGRIPGETEGRPGGRRDFRLQLGVKPVVF